MRKMFEWNKCKVNEPHAKLKHRRFYDYDDEALKRASRSFVMILCVNWKTFGEWNADSDCNNCFESCLSAVA